MSSNPKPKLLVQWCDHKAAKFAVEHWHYSKRLPSTFTKPVYIGAWEDDRFVGVVIFSMSSCATLGRQFGVGQFERCELIRVALRSGHRTPVSRIIRIAIMLMRKHAPRIRLIISFADMGAGHHGGIYQAGNWVYTGVSKGGTEIIYKGRKTHQRAVVCSRGTIKGLRKTKASDKHRYAYPLDVEMAAVLEKMRQPYPKRAGSVDIGTAGVQPERDGANPIPALQSSA